jgi:hypothetical protein
MAMAWRSLSGAGTGSSQSALTRARWARPPLWLSPTPQPFSSTWSPGLKRASSLASTVPAKSMPATSGNLRTTGLRPVMARPSLKLIVLYATRTVTSPAPSTPSSTSFTAGAVAGVVLLDQQGWCLRSSFT